ncbi:BON domain-containing protein [Chrysiogenes arsenatis]|uniref:BON domain-containing protein n=1 Tax=Chrysiogenes arsenatis TaxID=309797 RepID=UPI00047F3F69|nr:BON domain-containing protein [Chrysiogenes arsenatis]
MRKLSQTFLLVIFVVFAMTFSGCAATSERESTGQYVDDTVITTKVKTAIFQDETLKMHQINVETFKGVVQLSGFVDSALSVTKAGSVARAIPGVTSVKNDLLVK